MSGGFDIQSFFKSVSSTPPPQPQAEHSGPPPPTYGGPNQGPPPPLPPGFGAPPPPGYMHPQQFQGPPSGPFPFHLLGQQQPPPFQGGHRPQQQHPHFQGGNPSQQQHPPFQGPPSGAPNSAGANLMALLRGPPPASAPPPVPQHSPEAPPAANGFEAPPMSAPVATQPNPPSQSAAPTAPPLTFAPGSPPAAGAKASWFRGKAKKGTGRVLSGAHVVYDIDEKREGETKPQLEVHTISKVPLEYRLELGREIAVNRNYICYGMKTGSVRILSQIEDAKVLLKEHSQRLTDLAVFAEDVNLLSSASSDGRVFLHEVVGRGKKDTKARPIMGLQWPPEGGALHVAWNPRQQEHLAIVQGNSFYLAEVSRLQQQLPPPQDGEPAPLLAVDPTNPAPGLRLVGTHADVIVDVSFSPAGDRIASASRDGRVKVWGGEGDRCLSELTPHSGEAVCSVRFVGTGDEIVLVTGGPANREIKLWVAGGEGAEWQCVQTVELTSAEGAEAFFNHLHVDHRSGLLFLANTLRKSMYVLNLRRGAGSAQPPAFDYLAEFSFTAPVLSYTTLNEGVVDGEETVEIYAVQPEKIQRYALDAALCRPPPEEEAAPPQAPVAAPGPLSPMILSQLTEAPPTAHKPLVPEVPSAPTAEQQAHPPEPTPENEPSAPDAPEGLDVSVQKQPGVSPDLTREFSGREHGHVNLGVGSRGLVQNMNELKKQASRSRTGSPARQQGLEAKTAGTKEAEGVKTEESAKVETKTEQGVEKAPEIPPLEAAAPVAAQETATEEAKGVEEASSQEAPKLPEAPKTSEAPKLLTPAMLMGGPKVEEPQPAAPPQKKDAGATNGAKGRQGGAKQHVGSPPRSKGGNNVKWAPKVGGPEVVSSAPPVEGLSYDDVMKGVAAKKEEPKSKKEPTKANAAPPATAAVAALAVPPPEKEDGAVLKDSEEAAGPSEGERGEPEKKRKGKEKEKGPAQAEAEAATKAEKLEDVTAALQTGAPEAPAGEGLVDPAALTSGGFLLAEKAKGRKKNKGGNLATAAAVPPPQTPAEAAPGPSAPAPPSQGTVAVPTDSNEMLQQVKQIPGGVATAVAKEGKRIETALALRLEKVIKANAEAQAARAEEERAKREKAEKLRMDTALQAITGALSRDLPALVEKSVKKELAAAAPAMSQLLGPAIEKSVQDALVKGDGNKDLTQLEKAVGAKLEASLSRQVQAQFQTTLKAALQETLRTSFQGLLLPSFEAATRAMFEQIEGAVRGGMADHAQNAQHAGAAANGALASTLQDTITSASALVSTLQSEIAEGQRKLVALAEASGKQRTASLTKQGNGGLPDGAISLQHVEESLDPTKELSRLLAGGKYEEAFLKALNAFDVPMVTWLCNQVDPNAIFASHPLPLSQGVLLWLVSQLGSELAKDTSKKLDWISQAVLAINPEDPLLAPHMRPYLEQLYQSLHAQLQAVPSGGDVSRSLRTIIHVVNSLLTSCK